MGTRLGDVVGLPEPALRLSDVLRGGDEWREGRARMARLARGGASLSLSGWGRALPVRTLPSGALTELSLEGSRGRLQWRAERGVLLLRCRHAERSELADLLAPVRRVDEAGADGVAPHAAVAKLHRHLTEVAGAGKSRTGTSLARTCACTCCLDRAVVRAVAVAPP